MTSRQTDAIQDMFVACDEVIHALGEDYPAAATMVENFTAAVATQLDSMFGNAWKSKASAATRNRS